MVPLDPEPSPSDLASPTRERNTPQSPPPSPEPAPKGISRLWALALVAALVAGSASWLAGEVILNAYQGDLLPMLKIRPDPEDTRRLDAARVNSAAATFMMMGGMLGLALGLAGGLARHSASAGARPAILGLLLGAATPAGIAILLLPIFFRGHDPQSNDLMMSLLTQGAIWSSVGAVGGLVFGVGLGGRSRWKATLAGGIAGAAAATIVYEIAGALAFPTGKTELPLSSSMPARADGTNAGRDLHGGRSGSGRTPVAARTALRVRFILSCGRKGACRPGRAGRADSRSQ